MKKKTKRMRYSLKLMKNRMKTSRGKLTQALATVISRTIRCIVPTASIGEDNLSLMTIHHPAGFTAIKNVKPRIATSDIVAQRGSSRAK